ncbi:PaaI family thioesterase [Methanoregula sp.]|uniref:PaaI family thioesterase n=1 Tax=Methanoregula sp. TaxID=2052170 RepID=UPI0026202A8F|nr:PaaI family thioesterase [Methanoregula sp.]MDD5141831.1 PaaI family thioesterase [Methanoregula sp.]
MTCNPEFLPDTTAIKATIQKFNESEFARLLGIVVEEARDGYARVTMDCTGKANPSGVVHGGAIASLADQAFGIAENCAGIHRVAVSIHIQYLIPGNGLLVAIAERVQDNGSCDTCRVLVYASDRIIAEFTGVAFRVD